MAASSVPVGQRRSGRLSKDAQCDLTRDTLWDLLREPLDGPKWQVQNLATPPRRSVRPIIIGHPWQSNATGTDS